MRKLISTGSPLERRVSYSRAVVSGEWIFVAGTTGYEFSTMTMPDSPKEQARNALRTIEAALAEAGASLADVVRATYYVSNRNHAEGLFDVVGEAFRDVRPAATLIVCDLLRPEMKVEIEVTAHRPA
jgi:enamine deaminase RidA (YjgF/YER057c/UK114 family)